MAKAQHIETSTHPTALIVGVEAPYNRTPNISAYYDEFLNLLRTSNIKYEQAVFMKLREISHKTFFTTGKLEEIRELCKKHSVEDVYLSEPITSLQAKNIEDYLDCNIIDRTDLILDIFRKAAHTAEGQAQVGIAALEHAKTRLTGKGIHLSQQRGGIGIKGGAGEKLKEKEIRYIDSLIRKLKKQLEQLQKTRDTQRKRRQTMQVPQICLIGYTNAGKSTILNLLTKAEVLAEDKLFATLDTTTRELYIEGKKKGVLSDTVGFIQYLPHKLVDAFKSTLSELKHADLLLEVIDSSDPDWHTHINVVQEILEELEVEKPILYIFNKIDKLTEEQLSQLKKMVQEYNPHILVSAKTKAGIKPLITYLAQLNLKK